MADFGLRVKNNGGQIQVDSTFMNLNIVSRGLVPKQYWQPFPSSPANCTVFLKIPPSVVYSFNGVGMVFGMIDATSGSPSNGFGYTGRFNGSTYDPVPDSLEFAIATVGTPQSPPSGSFGMRVWDASGNLCFNSLFNQPRIVSANSGTFGNLGTGIVPYLDIPMPNSSQNFWVSMPLGGLLADSWYDGTQELMDVASAGVGWVNSSTLRIITNPQYTYPIGSGGRIVTHEDCYGATISAMAAVI